MIIYKIYLYCTISPLHRLFLKAIEKITYHPLQSFLLELYAKLNHRTPVGQMVYPRCCTTSFLRVLPIQSHLALNHLCRAAKFQMNGALQL